MRVARIIALSTVSFAAVLGFQGTGTSPTRYTTNSPVEQTKRVGIQHAKTLSKLQSRQLRSNHRVSASTPMAVSPALMDMAASGTSGGALIGLAAAVLLLGNGDILGCSGIVSSSFLRTPRKMIRDTSAHWKLLLLSAMTLTSFQTYTPPALAALTAPSLSAAGFAVAGLFVGFGTKLGNGCTSGHGICGLARWSIRSFAAVLTFMASAAITTTLAAWKPISLLSATTLTATSLASPNRSIAAAVTAATVGAGVLIPLLAKLKGQKSAPNDIAKIGPALAAGTLFSLGLQRSGMAQSAKVSGFLNLFGFAKGTWDPTLMFVMGGGVVISWLSYQWVQGHQTITSCPTLSCPLVLKEGYFSVPSIAKIDSN